MEKAKILERLIKEQGYSLKSFSAKCAIPYTTLYGIMKNGVGKATVDNVMAICHGLGITMDDLEKMANDKKQQSQNPLMRMWNALWQEMVSRCLLNRKCV